MEAGSDVEKPAINIKARKEVQAKLTSKGKKRTSISRLEGRRTGTLRGSGKDVLADRSDYQAFGEAITHFAVFAAGAEAS